MDGQIGREETLAGYIDALVAVFAEVHRVLKPTGTVWLNLGDCYAASAKSPQKRGDWQQRTQSRGANQAASFLPPDCGLKPKDLMLVPARVAIALQEWGWWLRSEIVWAKAGGGMPESVKDRPSASHEKIWLLTKQGRGYFYSDPQVPAAGVRSGARFGETPGRNDCAKTYTPRQDGAGSRTGIQGQASNAKLADGCYGNDDEGPRRNRRLAGLDAYHSKGKTAVTRRLRNYERAPEQVWEMRSAMYPGAHFATFPLSLVERCLDAGCPPGGVVLDPFGGAGTTALVALSTGRTAVLCELSEEYAALARERVESGGRMDSDLRRRRREERDRAQQEAQGQGSLL